MLNLTLCGVTNQLHPGVCRYVLEHDDHALRFEAFCLDLLTEVEGGTVLLPTSRSWDGGKDGRTVGPGPRILLCASITSELPAKIRSDLQKLAARGAQADALYFCTSQDASDHTLELVTSEAATLLPGIKRAEGLGSRQLVRLSLHKDTSIRKHYSAELAEVVATIVSDNKLGADDRESYLLALEVANSESSSALRAAVYRTALLRVLADRAPRNLGDCCRDLAGQLRLSRNMPPIAVRQWLNVLCDDGLLTRDGERFVLTDAGSAAVTDKETEAVKQLMEGRQRIRDRVEELCKTQFTDSQWLRIWNALQGKLAHEFQVRGHRLLCMIAQLTGDSTPEPEPASASEHHFVDDIADAAARACSLQDQGEEVRVAVADVFREPGPAHDWLVRVASSFVTLCTLGIEATSGNKLRQVLANMSVVVDSDVVLDLLGEGEPNHQAATDLVAAWRLLGGTLYAARPVLEEVAHHAWIASSDRAEVPDELLRTPEDRRRYSRNVFVRWFAHLVSNNRARRRDWDAFISDYKGRGDWDGSAVLEYLSSEFGLRALPDAVLTTGAGASLKAELEKGIRWLELSAREAEIKKDKLKRDARLFTSTQALGKSVRDLGGDQSVVLVSSSRRLRQFIKLHGNGVDRAISLGDAVYLVSMAPGISVGLSAMSALLFDGQLSPRTTTEEMLVLRTVRSIDNAFPWARRHRLHREVRSRMFSAAKDRDSQAPSETTASPAAPRPESSHEPLAVALAGAMDAVGLDSRAERKVAELEREVQRLTKQLAAAKR